jgi:hypothetical protein
MTATEFVNAFRKQAPDIKQPAALTISTEFIAQPSPMYRFPQKKSDLIYKDSLLELVANYDLKNIEIGMVTFRDELSEDDNYYYIGNVEVDLLVKSKQSGIIQVLEFDQPSKLLWSCATNGALFLDALLVCDNYLEKCVLDEALFENEIVRAAMVSECSEMAGGIEYIDFYEMLRG